MKLAIGLSILAVVSACARSRVETTIRPDLVGSKYARVTGYMATIGAAPGGKHTEETPSDLRHDTILDEATLARVTAGETCAEVVVRTARGFDEPLEQLTPTFEINGAKHKGVVDNETVSVTDYDFVARTEKVSYERASAHSYTGLKVTEPEDRVFRVVERRASICAPVGGTVKSVALELEHPYWKAGGFDYHLVFAWKLS